MFYLFHKTHKKAQRADFIVSPLGFFKCFLFNDNYVRIHDRRMHDHLCGDDRGGCILRRGYIQAYR